MFYYVKGFTYNILLYGAVTNGTIHFFLLNIKSNNTYDIILTMVNLEKHHNCEQCDYNFYVHIDLMARKREKPFCLILCCIILV